MVDSALQTLPISANAWVKQASGSVQYCNDGATWHALSKGQKLSPGTTIRVANNANALLWLDETENYLRLSANTSILLDKTAEQKSRDLADLRNEEIEGSAKVRAVRGHAEYFDQGEWKLLKVNSLIVRGTIVRTKGEATADLFFPGNGLVVRMLPQTVLRLDALNFTWAGPSPVIESLIVVAQGQILTNSRGTADESKFKFQQAQVLYEIKKEASVTSKYRSDLNRFAAGN